MVKNCLYFDYVLQGTYLMQETHYVDNKDSKWLIYAITSAIFASFTSILAKIGIQNVDSQTVTAIRTIVVVIMAWLVVESQKALNHLSS